MYVPVVRESHSPFFLDLSELIFIKREQKNIWFATKSHSYRMVSSIKDLDEALNDTNFMRVNQDIIVNKDYIEGYDFTQNRLYFESAGEDGTEYCYVSRENQTKTKNALMFKRR